MAYACYIPISQTILSDDNWLLHWHSLASRRRWRTWQWRYFQREAGASTYENWFCCLATDYEWKKKLYAICSNIFYPSDALNTCSCKQQRVFSFPKAKEYMWITKLCLFSSGWCSKTLGTCSLLLLPLMPCGSGTTKDLILPLQLIAKCWGGCTWKTGVLPVPFSPLPCIRPLAHKDSAKLSQPIRRGTSQAVAVLILPSVWEHKEHIWMELRFTLLLRFRHLMAHNEAHARHACPLPSLALLCVPEVPVIALMLLHQCEHNLTEHSWRFLNLNWLNPKVCTKRFTSHDIHSCLDFSPTHY